MGVKPPMAWEKNFFHHVIWITVVFRSNDSRCLLWKFSAIRVTRWLLWHPNCIKFNFGPGPCWGSLRRSPDPLVGWVGGIPSQFPAPLDAFGVETSARVEPSALYRRRGSTLTPSSRISGYATDYNYFFNYLVVVKISSLLLYLQSIT